MLSTQDYDCWFVGILFFVLIRDFDKRHVDSTVGFTDTGKFDELERRGFCDVLDLSEVRLHLGVTVWHRVRDVNLILLVIKLKIKTHCIVRLWFVRVHLINFHMIR